MPTLTVVELKVLPEPLHSFGNRAVCFQIYIFIFHTPPEAFNEHVVHPAALAVHADVDTMTFKDSKKRLRCKLAAIVGVEYIRGPEFPERLFKRPGAERGVQRV